MFRKSFPGGLVALLLFFALVTSGCGTDDYEDNMRRNSSVPQLSPSPVTGSEPG